MFCTFIEHKYYRDSILYMRYEKVKLYNKSAIKCTY